MPKGKSNVGRNHLRPWQISKNTDYFLQVCLLSEWMNNAWKKERWSVRSGPGTRPSSTCWGWWAQSSLASPESMDRSPGPSAEVLSFSTIVLFQRSLEPCAVLSLWTLHGPFNACLCFSPNHQWGLPREPSFCLVVSPSPDGELFLACSRSCWFCNVMISAEWKCRLFPQTNYPAPFDESWFWWEWSWGKTVVELLKWKGLRGEGLGACQKPPCPATCYGLSQSSQLRTPRQPPQPGALT